MPPALPPATPPSLRVRLLGAFGATLDGKTLDDLDSPRLQSLFAYLVLHRDTAHLRQQLAFLFWPDSSESQARNNLRQLLHQMRRVWPSADRCLAISGGVLRWRPDLVLVAKRRRLVFRCCVRDVRSHPLRTGVISGVRRWWIGHDYPLVVETTPNRPETAA